MNIDSSVDIAQADLSQPGEVTTPEPATVALPSREISNSRYSSTALAVTVACRS